MQIFKWALLPLAMVQVMSAWAGSDVDMVEETMVVTSSRTPMSLTQANGSIQVVDAKRLNEKLTTNLSEVLQTLPNVAVSGMDNPISSRVSIRGASPLQNIYLIDGMRQDNYTSAGNAVMGAFIDPEMLKQVEVKLGGGSVLYGNGGIGGVVSLQTKSASDLLEPGESFGVKVKTGYNSAKKRWSRAAWSFGRYENLDVVFGVVRRDHENIKLSIPSPTHQQRGDFTSTFIKTQYWLDEASVLTAMYSYDEGNDQWSDASTYNQYFNKQHRASVQFEKNESDNVNLKMNLQWTSGQNHYENEMTGYQNNFHSLGGTIQNTWFVSMAGRHNITVGADINHTAQDGISHNFATGGQWVESTERADATSLDVGVFLRDQYRLQEHWRLTPSFRYSYYQREAQDQTLPKVHDHAFTPGIELAYLLERNARVWTSWSMGYRPPILDELYYRMTLPRIHSVIIPNPDIKPEKSRHVEIGFSWDQQSQFLEHDRVQMRGTLFHDEVRDAIVADQWIDSDTWYYQTKNLGHVARTGVEWSLSYRWKQWDGSLSYAYLNAKDKENHRKEENVVPQSVHWRIGYDWVPEQLTSWYRGSWNEAPKFYKKESPYEGNYTIHSVGLTWAPKVPNFWDFQLNLVVDNLTNEHYRVTNTAGLLTGYARNVRLRVSGQF